MNKILILTGCYLPGFKDGGPLRSINNLVNALGDKYDFHIVCRDRDNGDSTPYPNIKYNDWNNVGAAKVWYVKPRGYSISFLKKIASEMDHIYLCSFYENYGYKTLLLNRFNKLNIPITVASMGVFSAGALSQKSFKKKVFISLCKVLGLFKNITWSVTSELEADDLKKAIGATKYIIAEDLPRSSIPGYTEKNHDVLQVVFISRISPSKNLSFAIQSLQHVEHNIEFNIYGPIEDQGYWCECQKSLQKLPEHVKWTYRGAIDPDKVQEVFAQNDIFLFPTLGENYGHVIFEALSVGCIPVISDLTPWNFIDDANAGNVLPLEMRIFTSTIEKLATMPFNERAKISRNGVEIARGKANQSIKDSGYRKIFDNTQK